ncbi:monocarboxylate transporter 14-like isoform X1 [Haliotis rufescens]|uniref:monocarboxylate transporter 14-like isoform X1 n=1 Tax=Haliotis rufescens TaxID=6454 RepID=UPI00201FB387|nr:monocarboxylate transporter 14-like isoform X1 [Haliotis rufescens]
MAREIEKGHGKREEKGCENVTDKDDLNTADKQLTLSCVDLRITTAQHLNETRKAPPSALKHEGNSRIKLVVLTGACYNIFVALGFPFAIGALYLEILDTFNSTRGETSLVPAFCLGCTFGVGFLSGFFIQRCGMKTVMVAGGLVSSLGLFTSWFPQSVVHLIVTVGVINGFGNSFIFISITKLVAGTFNKSRSQSLALAGIMFSGGIGTILFPYILATLNSLYGWRGTFLLISCFYLQTIVSTLVITSSLGNPQFFKGQRPTGHVTGKESKSKWKLMLKPVFVSFVITSGLKLWNSKQHRWYFIGFG